MYDTAEKMADSEISGIDLIDKKRPSCITCVHGKQSKHEQSKKDSPIDRIGGSICIELKDPMTPPDRCGGRYMINFVDHSSNYCRVFVARKKDLAPTVFEHFKAFCSAPLIARCTLSKRTAEVNTRTSTYFARRSG